MIISKANYVILINIILTAISLFYIKNNVRSFNTELSEIKQQIEAEKDKILFLKAEIAYLTSPSKLKQTINNSLSLSTVMVSQLINDPLEDDSKIEQQKLVASLPREVVPVKWRFKKNIVRHNNVQPVLIKNH